MGGEIQALCEMGEERAPSKVRKRGGKLRAQGSRGEKKEWELDEKEKKGCGKGYL